MPPDHRAGTTSVRIDTSTHEALKRIASDRGTTVGGAVTLAVRALRQGQVGNASTSALCRPDGFSRSEATSGASS
jgi:hypothetical protein